MKCCPEIGCGTSNPNSAKYCLNCGRAFPSSDSFESLESLQFLSVLVLDLAGFTAFSAQYPPDKVHSQLSSFFEDCRRVIELEKGQITAFEGDCLIACFGLDSESTDSPVQACYAALRLHKTFLKFQQKNPDFLQLKYRVGIDCGRLLVQKNHQKTVLFGEALDNARKLEKASELNAITISLVIRKAVRERFRVVHQGLKADGMRVFRLLGKSSMRCRKVLGKESQISGRTKELQLMLEAFLKSRSDEKSLVFELKGEVGLGKTRLMQEFKESLRLKYAPLYFFPCFFGNPDGTAYRLIRSFLAQWNLQTPEQIDQQMKIDCFENYQQCIPEGAAAIYSLVAKEEVSEECFQSALKAMTFWLEAVASKVPVVFLLDDFHKVDEGSLRMIRYLLKSLKKSVYFLAASRIEDSKTRNIGRVSRDFFSADFHYQECVLGNLSRREMTELFQNYLGQPGNDSSKVVLQELLDLSQGNPLYGEEYLLHCHESGALFETSEGTFSLNQEVWKSLKTPQAVGLVLQGRLARLSHPKRDLLELASCFGKIFPKEGIAKISGHSKSELKELRELGFILKERHHQFLSLGSWCFSHEVIRDHIYHAMTAKRRRSLHGHIADWIRASLGQSEQTFQILKYHLEKSRQKPGFQKPNHPVDNPSTLVIEQQQA